MASWLTGAAVLAALTCFISLIFVLMLLLFVGPPRPVVVLLTLFKFGFCRAGDRGFANLLAPY